MANSLTPIFKGLPKKESNINNTNFSVFAFQNNRALGKSSYHATNNKFPFINNPGWSWESLLYFRDKI